MTVGVLGAGMSGVLMGMQLRMAGIDDFVLYEKQPDVGGTWLRNTYPGLHCDVPSHLYCYSFERNPDWSSVYAAGAEIQRYLRACAEKYDLIDHIRFSSCVETASFDDDRGTWHLTLDDGTTAEHRVLVAATGGITEPHLPRLDGLQSFAGQWWHSGSWRHDVELSEARVAVVGSAASAVQVVPAVAERAAKVTVFSRTPNWILPRNNAPYDDADRRRLRSESEWRRVRRGQWRDMLLWRGAFTNDHAAVDRIKALTMDAIRACIDDQATIDALTPSYQPGCKRILVSDDYYPTLAQPHVDLVPLGVVGLTPEAVVAADGSTTTVDVVVFCTGYKTGGRADGRPAVEVYGRDGLDLRTALGTRPQSYRGVAVPGFPNYFTVCGINGSIGHAPQFMPAEVGTDYITRWVRQLIDNDLHSVEVRADVTHDWSESIQDELQQMSWSGDCPGFYRDRSGRILAFHPGSIGRLRRELRELHEEDWIVRAR